MGKVLAYRHVCLVGMCAALGSLNCDPLVKQGFTRLQDP